MSFNFKQKIVIKWVNPEKVFSEYEASLGKRSTTNGCHFCNKNHKKLHFGIPISIKEEDEKQVFEVCGQYCSLTCAYKDYLKFSGKAGVKQNVKFCDSEPCFRILSYILYKTADISDDPELTSSFNSANVSFLFVNPNIIK
jgi:hypothetical protein